MMLAMAFPLAQAPPSPWESAVSAPTLVDVSPRRQELAAPMAIRLATRTSAPTPASEVERQLREALLP